MKIKQITDDRFSLAADMLAVRSGELHACNSKLASLEYYLIALDLLTRVQDKSSWVTTVYKQDLATSFRSARKEIEAL